MIRLPRRLSNRLAVVSALQLLLVSGGFGLLSYSLGRRSGLLLSDTVRQNASVVELATRLSTKLSYPIWINELNLNWLTNEPKRAENVTAISERFWSQMQVFPVDYINFGSADGSFVGMERTSKGALLLNEDTRRSGRGAMAVYAMTPRGERAALLERIPGMAATHEEAWYVDTVKAGKPTWSSIYAWEDQPEVFSISYNAPVYGPQRSLRGVVGVDMVLSQLSTWLRGVWNNQRGLALIVEPSGDLVASSRVELTLRRQGARIRRANIAQLSEPLAQQLNQQFFKLGPQGHLQVKAGSLDPDQIPRRVNVGGQAYTLQASPWGQAEGLRWILLTALEVDPNTTAAEQQSLLALITAVIALAGAVLLISRQIQALLTPLSKLEEASRQLGERLKTGETSSPAALHFTSGLPPSAGHELLALDRAISELVERYNQLTVALDQARERERQRDAQTLTLLQEKLRSSLQAAAVAHEINQPLSVLLLQSQLLLERSRALGAPTLPEAWQEQLQSIHHEADRVVLTIEKMRALLRNVQTEHQRLDLREIAQSALLYARSGGSTAGIDVDSSALDAFSGAAWINADAVQVQIAIVNLLRNAAEAVLDAAAAKPWISVNLSRQGDQWWFEVADNGPGLSPDVLCTPPLQTSKRDGCGLGLYVVQTTMENHQGTVETARSARGGALLRLRFPIAPNGGLPSTGD